VGSPAACVTQRGLLHRDSCRTLNERVATLTEPHAWLVELDDGNHLVAVAGEQLLAGGFGLIREATGQVCVDGRPVRCEVITPRGYVFAYLEREWRFTLGGHACVIRQGMAGVPIWDLWMDGQRIPHVAMSRRRVLRTAGELLLALAISLSTVALIILGLVRVLAWLGAPGQ
jgi:hypothetical protein